MATQRRYGRLMGVAVIGGPLTPPPISMTCTTSESATTRAVTPRCCRWGQTVQPRYRCGNLKRGVIPGGAEGVHRTVSSDEFRRCYTAARPILVARFWRFLRNGVSQSSRVRSKGEGAMAVQRRYGRFMGLAVIGGPLLLSGIAWAGPARADTTSYLQDLHNAGIQEVNGDAALLQTGQRLCVQSGVRRYFRTAKGAGAAALRCQTRRSWAHPATGQ
jgi:hypothetical protein